MTLATLGTAPLISAAPATFAAGYYVGDGSGAFNVNLGFSPLWVKVVDLSATTSPTTWEWMLGILPSSDNGLTQVTTGGVTLDGSASITTNWASFTQVSAGIYQPGTSEPGDGTIINSGNITVYSPNGANPYLTLATGLNTSTHKYAWVAAG